METMNPPQSTTPSNPDQKILKDLSTLTEQISLCKTLMSNLAPGESIESSDALLTVIGFLEACVPRMVELIEAGSAGAFDDGDGTLVKCLEVNDELVNILKDVDEGTPGKTEGNDVTSQPNTLEEVNFGSFKIEDDDENGTDDLTVKEDNTKRPGAAALEDLLSTPNTQDNEKDPFDDFLGERMNAKTDV